MKFKTKLKIAILSLIQSSKCCLQLNDLTWEYYRGEIKEVLTAKMANVKLLDIGLNVDVALSDIFRVDSKKLELGSLSKTLGMVYIAAFQPHFFELAILYGDRHQTAGYSQKIVSYLGSHISFS